MSARVAMRLPPGMKCGRLKTRKRDAGQIMPGVSLLLFPVRCDLIASNVVLGYRVAAAGIRRRGASLTTRVDRFCVRESPRAESGRRLLCAQGSALRSRLAS